MAGRIEHAASGRHSWTPYPKAIQWLILELKPVGVRPAVFAPSRQEIQSHSRTSSLDRSRYVRCDPTTFDLEMTNTVPMSAALSLSEEGKWELCHIWLIRAALRAVYFAGGRFQRNDGDPQSGRLQSGCGYSGSQEGDIPADLSRLGDTPENLGSFQLVLGSKRLRSNSHSRFRVYSTFLGSPSRLIPNRRLFRKKLRLVRFVKLLREFELCAGKGSKPGWSSMAKLRR